MSAVSITVFDIVVLLLGVVSAIVSGRYALIAGVVIGFVVLHFFLFCNVFRIRRKMELLWAAVFVILASCTLHFGFPGWLTTFLLAASCTLIILYYESRRSVRDKTNRALSNSQPKKNPSQ